MQRAGIVFVALLACTPRVAPVLPGDPPPASRPSKFTVARPTPFSAERRLPRPLVPTSYRAQLSLDDDRIHGTLAITGDLAAATDTLWVHADELVIQHARATSATRTVLLEPRTPIGDRRIALLAERPLPPGRWTVELTYTAKI